MQNGLTRARAGSDVEGIKGDKKTLKVVTINPLQKTARKVKMPNPLGTATNCTGGGLEKSVSGKEAPNSEVVLNRKNLENGKLQRNEIHKSKIGRQTFVCSCPVESPGQRAVLRGPSPEQPSRLPSQHRSAPTAGPGGLTRPIQWGGELAVSGIFNRC